MMGLLGKKIGMTTAFTQDGKRVPVTIISAGPCRIIQIKTIEKDGYFAVQLGYDPLSKEKNVTKPMIGHFRKYDKKAPIFRKVKEFTIDNPEKQFQIGQELHITDIFKEGEFVDCTGISKGKGFQGAVKLHHFGGGPKTHGQSDRTRAPGSVGASSFPSKVNRGMRMAAHMGCNTVTVKKLQIVKIMKDDHLILVKGSIAGPKGGYVIIKKTG